MDDATAGLPEANAVLGAGRRQEVIHLLVSHLGVLQVGDASERTLPAPAAQLLSGRRLLLTAGLLAGVQGSW